MTRVLMSLAVLEYRQAMAELVREVCEKPVITGLNPRSQGREPFPARKDPPALRLEGLLRPPGIETLDAFLFPAEEQVDGIIHIAASGDYGIVDVYVTLQDDRGNRSKAALPCETR